LFSSSSYLETFLVLTILVGCPYVGLHATNTNMKTKYFMLEATIQKRACKWNNINTK
jgi:hypothetical protein